MTLFYPHYSRNENATKIRQNLEKSMWTGALLTLLDRHETIRNQWKTAAIMVIVWLARRINPTWSSGEGSEFGKKNGHDSKWVSPKSKRCHTNIYIYCERVILFWPGPISSKKDQKRLRFGQTQSTFTVQWLCLRGCTRSISGPKLSEWALRTHHLPRKLCMSCWVFHHVSIQAVKKLNLYPLAT